MKFGISTNPEKDPGLEATQAVIDALTKAGLDVYYDDELAKIMGMKNFKDASLCDVLFIVGGDGTILRAAHKYVKYGIFLAGVNLGRMGFMSEISLNEVADFIGHVERGEFFIDRRMMLEAFVPSHKMLMYALNDFAVVRKDYTKVARMDLFVNGKLAENYNGDGLIVATPTGSTAYSLSAGGPIVAPNMECIVITPICPHSLYARSIVARPDDEVRVRVASRENGMMLSVDGRHGIDLAHGDTVEIKVTDTSAKFIRINEDAFFPQLKAKLAQWTDRN